MQRNPEASVIYTIYKSLCKFSQITKLISFVRMVYTTCLIVKGLFGNSSSSQFLATSWMSNFGKKCSSLALGLRELVNSLIELVSILFSPPLSWIHQYDAFTCSRATKAHHKMCLPPTWSCMPMSMRANPQSTISFHSYRLLTKVQQAYTATEIKCA